jgi:acetate kinase
MGFSGLNGLVMATRCGSVDIGAIFYIARSGKSFADIENLLYRDSGLFGASGLNGDIRDLITSQNPRTRAAVDLFSNRAGVDIAVGLDASANAANGNSSSTRGSRIDVLVVPIDEETTIARNAEAFMSGATT